MNEELQSMNDELQSTNEELRERTSEVGELNAFMSSVFAGLRAGVVVVDSDLLVQVWNNQAEELWGVRHDEATGRPEAARCACPSAGTSGRCRQGVGTP